MKKVFLLIIVFVFFASCKESKKKDNFKVEVKENLTFTLKKAENKINWIAYKTTKKVGVKGEFKKVNIVNGGEGKTIREAINNTEFSIPVSSIFTSNPDRDSKIKKLFFGVMDNTELLSGRLNIQNDSTGFANIKMNNITQKLSFTYTIKDSVFSMNSVMSLSDWNTSSALSSLNKACGDLHKGSDGISKTWNEVLINISSDFK